DRELRLKELELHQLASPDGCGKEELHLGLREGEWGLAAAEEPEAGHHQRQAEREEREQELPRLAAGDGVGHGARPVGAEEDPPEIDQPREHRDRIARLTHAAELTDGAVAEAPPGEPEKGADHPPVSARKMSSSPRPASCGRSAMISPIAPMATRRPFWMIRIRVHSS